MPKSLDHGRLMLGYFVQTFGDWDSRHDSSVNWSDTADYDPKIACVVLMQTQQRHARLHAALDDNLPEAIHEDIYPDPTVLCYPDNRDERHIMLALSYGLRPKTDIQWYRVKRTTDYGTRIRGIQFDYGHYTPDLHPARDDIASLAPGTFEWSNEAGMTRALSLGVRNGILGMLLDHIEKWERRARPFANWSKVKDGIRGPNAENERAAIQEYVARKMPTFSTNLALAYREYLRLDRELAAQFAETLDFADTLKKCETYFSGEFGRDWFVPGYFSKRANHHEWKLQQTVGLGSMKPLLKAHPDIARLESQA